MFYSFSSFSLFSVFRFSFYILFCNLLNKHNQAGYEYVVVVVVILTYCCFYWTDSFIIVFDASLVLKYSLWQLDEWKNRECRKCSGIRWTSTWVSKVIRMMSGAALLHVLWMTYCIEQMSDEDTRIECFFKKNPSSFTFYPVLLFFLKYTRRRMENSNEQKAKNNVENREMWASF